jgi:hypothetical protein
MCKDIHGLLDFTFRLGPILEIHFSPDGAKIKKWQNIQIYLITLSL